MAPDGGNTGVRRETRATQDPSFLFYTGRNHNVFYEVGYGHSLDKGKVILITQEIGDVAFDLRGFRRFDPKLVPTVRAVLSHGPPAGTEVVTVGAAELFGTEFGVGK